ncbi:hypothetical protein NX059_012468 [Plenodomus lindquistii]|nr:hypothetical protein NX059_012468 [Plenodomus lindquistii]
MYDSQPVLRPNHIAAAVPYSRLDANVNAPIPLSTQQALDITQNLINQFKQILEFRLQQAFDSADLPWLVAGWPDWKVRIWVSDIGRTVENVVTSSRLLGYDDDDDDDDDNNNNNNNNNNYYYYYKNNYGFRALSRLRHDGQTKLPLEVADQLQMEWDNIQMCICQASFQLHFIKMHLGFRAWTFLSHIIQDYMNAALMPLDPHMCVPGDEAGLARALCLSVLCPPNVPAPLLGAHLLRRRNALVQPYENLSLDFVRQLVGWGNFPEFVRAWMRSISISLRPQDIDFFVNADPFGLHMPLATHVSRIQLCINTDASLERMPALEETISTAMACLEKTNPHGCTMFIDVFRPVPGHSVPRVAFDQDGLDAASRMMHFLSRGCFSTLPDKWNEFLVELRIWRCSTSQPVPTGDFLWLQRSSLATLSIQQWCALAEMSAAQREQGPDPSDDATFVPWLERSWINEHCSVSDYSPYPDGYGLPRHLILTDPTNPM